MYMTAYFHCFFQPCNCNSTGSADLQCDLKTGVCQCKAEYDGDKCNECVFGHFGFPHCTLCDCDVAGTQYDQCNEKGHCQCEDNRQCPCKVSYQLDPVLSRPSIQYCACSRDSFQAVPYFLKILDLYSNEETK